MDEGADSLTLKVLHFEGCKPSVEKAFYEPLSFKRHRFPGEVIRHAVWLYFRFNLSFRDVEELMAQGGIDVSYETIRCYTIKCRPLIALRLKKRRVPPTGRWHLDEMVCKIGGRRMYLWRAVDNEGEILDVIVQRQRDTKAALKLSRRLLRNQPVEPESIITDGLASYGTAFDQLELRHLHRSGLLRDNNRVENSHLPISATRAADAAVQVTSLSPEISHHIRSALQHLQHLTPSDQQTHTSSLSRLCRYCLGGGYRLIASGVGGFLA